MEGTPEALEELAEEALLARFAEEKDSDRLARIGAEVERRSTRQSAVALHRMLAGGALTYFQRAVATTLLDKLTAKAPLTDRELAQAATPLAPPPSKPGGAKASANISGTFARPQVAPKVRAPSRVPSIVLAVVATGLAVVATWSQSDRMAALTSSAGSPAEDASVPGVELHAVATSANPASFTSRRLVSDGTVVGIDPASHTVTVQKGQDTFSAVVPAASLEGLKAGDAIEVRGVIIGRSRFGTVFVQNATCARHR